MAFDRIVNIDVRCLKRTNQIWWRTTRNENEHSPSGPLDLDPSRNLSFCKARISFVASLATQTFFLTHRGKIIWPQARPHRAQHPKSGEQLKRPKAQINTAHQAQWTWILATNSAVLAIVQQFRRHRNKIEMQAQSRLTSKQTSTPWWKKNSATSKKLVEHIVGFYWLSFSESMACLAPGVADTEVVEGPGPGRHTTEIIPNDKTFLCGWQASRVQWI